MSFYEDACFAWYEQDLDDEYFMEYMEMTKVNSTGSLWIDGEGNFWSYRTQLTAKYKGKSIMNNTFFSRTTRKHQYIILNNYTGYYDVTLKDTYRSLEHVEEALRSEIDSINNEIDVRSHKRKTKANIAELGVLKERKNRIVNLLQERSIA